MDDKLIGAAIGVSAAILLMLIAWWMIFVMAIQTGIMYFAYKFGYEEAADEAETWMFEYHREAWRDWTALQGRTPNSDF